MSINYSDLLCSTYLPYTETEEATLFDSTHDFPCAANLRVLNFLTKNAISTKFSKFLKRFPKRSRRPFMLSQFSWFNPNVVETNPKSWLSLTPLNFKNLEKNVMYILFHAILLEPMLISMQVLLYLQFHYIMGKVVNTKYIPFTYSSN